MQPIQTFDTSGPSENDLARRLLRQVAEWKPMRAPLRMRTAAGVQVERLSRRRRLGNDVVVGAKALVGQADS